MGRAGLVRGMLGCTPHPRLGLATSVFRTRFGALRHEAKDMRFDNNACADLLPSTALRPFTDRA